MVCFSWLCKAGLTNVANKILCLQFTILSSECLPVPPFLPLHSLGAPSLPQSFFAPLPFCVRTIPKAWLLMKGQVYKIFFDTIKKPGVPALSACVSVLN